MATITQFQTDPVLIEMMNRHHAWHTAGGMHGFPSRQYAQGTPNSGREFFQFHHDMVNQFMAWNNMHGNVIPLAQLAAWSAIPVALKVPLTGWPVANGVDLAASETRITTNNPAFANDDALGIFVETTIHNWIHGAVAAVYNEPFIGQLHSPQSTYFYQIHGLVEMWWNQFLHPKTQMKDIIDHVGKVHIKEMIKEAIKEHKEHKEFKEKDIKDFKEKELKEHKEFKEKELKEHKEIKEKDKDLVENPKNFAEGIDPMRLHTVDTLSAQARARALDAQAAKGAPFIKATERPAVGKKVTKSPGKRK